ncbi:hypothetical protein AB0I53_18645 [Saccharopolyspora sp. NPDC050389]|uniref:hypothetical protein n=1 Tax=Saccharopolyspora sp. NPDC050389 TaxID=3155516 RepID=UPI0033EF5BA5
MIWTEVPARQKPPEMPGGELSLQEPPVIPEQVSGGIGGMLLYLPMALGSGAMMLMFMGNRGGIGIVVVALMAVSMLAMGFGQLGRSVGERKRRLRGERRDYMRYLGQVRKQVRTVAAEQRKALAWRHPDPAGLWSVAMRRDCGSVAFRTPTSPRSASGCPGSGWP